LLSEIFYLKVIFSIEYLEQKNYFSQAQKIIFKT
jgi:hypothetical protein